MGCSSSKKVSAPVSTANDAKGAEQTLKIVADSSCSTANDAKGAEQTVKTVADSSCFIATLERIAGEPLGATVVADGNTRLIVQALDTKGVVVGWNTFQMGFQMVGWVEHRVQPGDIISDVNGVAGDAEKMLEALNAVGKIQLTLQHKEEPEATSDEPGAEPTPAEEKAPRDQASVILDNADAVQVAEPEEAEANASLSKMCSCF